MLLPEITVVHVYHLILDVEALVVVLYESAARGIRERGHPVVDHHGVLVVWSALGHISIG